MNCRLSPVLRWLVALGAPAWLAACGGGIWIGYNGSDQPPQVSLATVSSASVGQSVRLAAAASDDGFIDHVSFYRIDDNGQDVLLGEDNTAPYELTVMMPSSVGGSVRFFAQAVDNIGQSADSATVSVAITP
jgi:hypothetical protein